MGFWSGLGKVVNGVGNFLSGGIGQLLGGVADAGASIYNTSQQVKMNDANITSQENMNTYNIASQEKMNEANLVNQQLINQQNIDFQREVNAQNQYNIEHSYQMAAKDLEQAGLSKALINGGASGSPQVAYASQASQGVAPQGVAPRGSATQTELGSILSNAFMNMALLKDQIQNTGIKQQEADTHERQVDNEHEEEMARLKQNEEHFNIQIELDRIKEAHSYKAQQDALAETKRQFDLSYQKDYEQFDAMMKQKDAQFQAEFDRLKEQFEKEYGQSVVMNDFTRKMAIQNYNWNVQSFLEEESNKAQIALNHDEATKFVGFTGFLGRLINTVIGISL